MKRLYGLPGAVLAVGTYSAMDRRYNTSFTRERTKQPFLRHENFPAYSQTNGALRHLERLVGNSCCEAFGGDINAYEDVFHRTAYKNACVGRRDLFCVNISSFMNYLLEKASIRTVTRMSI